MRVRSGEQGIIARVSPARVAGGRSHPNLQRSHAMGKGNKVRKKEVKKPKKDKKVTKAADKK